MKSGFTTTEIGRLRTRPQKSTWYVAVHRPASLVSGTLAAAPVSYPVSAITISGFAGSSALTDDHQTIWVGTTAGGSQKGRIRLRKAMTTTSRLYVSEAGSGLVNWQSGDFLSIMDEYAAWTKHPRYDTDASQWRIDYDEAYTSQLENYGPLVQMGAPFVGFLVNGSVTGSYIGGSTVFLDGATYSNASWVFPGAVVTPSALGTETHPVIRTYTQPYPDGKYVTLKVVDSTGASSKSKRLAFTFSDRTQPHRVEFGQITGGLRNGGYETELRVVSNATSATFPDMAEVVIFEEASYGTVGSSIGGNSVNRQNIVMRGWIIGDTVRINPFSGDVTFRVKTIDGIMRETFSYDAFLTNASAAPFAQHWIDASTLTIDRAAINLVKHRSTVGDIVDFKPASGIAMTEHIAFQDLPAGNWWSQLESNYKEKGVLGYVAADLQSNVFACFDTQINGGSANIPVAMHITRGDRRDQVVIDETTIEKNAEVTILSVTGASAASATPIGAISPGTLRGHFGGAVEHARGLFLPTQDLAATWAGNLRAKLNNKYGRNIVPLAGNYRIDSVPQSRITMSLSATDNPREISWNDEQFLPYQTQITYDSRAGVVLTDIEIEKVVQGIGGSAMTFPSIVTLAPEETPSPPPPPAPTPATPGTGFSTLYVMTSRRLGKTTDFSQSSPDYGMIATSQGLGGSFHDFILDPWRPKTVGYLMTSCGLYRSSTLSNSNPVFDLVLSKTQIDFNTGGTLANTDNNHRIMGSINEDGYVALFAAVKGSGIDTDIYCIHTHNDGASWSYAFVDNNPNSTFAGAADIVPWTVNDDKVLYVPSRQGGEVYMYKSVNHGHSFTQKAIIHPPQTVPRAVFCPYDGNQDGNIVYVGGDSNGHLARSVDGGNTFTSLTTDGDLRIKRWGVEAYTQDRTLMYLWRGTNELVISEDGFVTESTVSKTNFSGNIKGSGGFPYNGQLFYAVTSSAILVSANRGASWIDKSGNWPTRSSGEKDFEGDFEAGADVMRAAVIVPVWVE